MHNFELIHRGAKAPLKEIKGKNKGKVNEAYQRVNLLLLWKPDYRPTMVE